jgi:hypothetical protein
MVQAAGMLATLGAGSAASLKAAQLAKRADLPLAVSVVVVLQLVNIVAVPLRAWPLAWPLPSGLA